MAQLVARVVRDDEVVRSSRITPTRFMKFLLATTPNHEAGLRQCRAQVPPVDTKLLRNSNQVQAGRVETASLNQLIVGQRSPTPPLTRHTFPAQMGHHGVPTNAEPFGQDMDLFTTLAQGHQLNDLSLGQPGKTPDRPGSSSG